MSDDKKYVSWDEAVTAAIKIAEAARAIEEPDQIVGVARGGLPLAVMISHELETPLTTLRATHYDGTERTEDVEIHTDGLDQIGQSETVLLVDDVVDTGLTLQKISEMWSRYDVDYRTAVWHEKPGSEYDPSIVVAETDKWIVYPWEEPRATNYADQ